MLDWGKTTTKDREHSINKRIRGIGVKSGVPLNQAFVRGRFFWSVCSHCHLMVVNRNAAALTDKLLHVCWQWKLEQGSKHDHYSNNTNVIWQRAVSSWFIKVWQARILQDAAPPDVSSSDTDKNRATLRKCGGHVLGSRKLSEGTFVVWRWRMWPYLCFEIILAVGFFHLRYTTEREEMSYTHQFSTFFLAK